MTRLLTALALMLGAPAWAATPASGEFSESAGVLSYVGGPFVFSNSTGLAGAPVCAPDPAEQLCDTFTLTLNVSDEFRADEANAKEVISVALSFTPMAPVSDFDLYLYDSNGTLVAESAGGALIQEKMILPLKSFKNGTYTIDVIPYRIVGDSYQMDILLGRSKTAGGTAAPKVGNGLALGAWGFPALFALLGFVLVRLKNDFVFSCSFNDVL